MPGTGGSSREKDGSMTEGLECSSMFRPDTDGVPTLLSVLIATLRPACSQPR
ncbi:hypothetical protein Pmar_PMAR009565 [Perkinsus marinus ATCC 50983]|uniref:Uncharacterized protein n=1 Tax=Perkinsus marinus (strain ATCC 50983 / TXsc) TaxID=423536 RepID=C5KEJ2_PERM5|nr:hypothetical protein Pmar_PMAR009565 [Perkinsus marinus ATCC 50983]EER17130.1 hypothetical protein Pmar_PMAR009565 [Perkinsus marinus ATCC 50983]|eukprot:XP_002785334.1 hypothetical protein Pmar_PMAR009565 [Perkinsus marinus ATCC 50983]